MSSDGDRSRSPKGEANPSKAKPSKAPGGEDKSSADPSTWSDQIWDEICPKLDVKLEGFQTVFKESVKTVVNTMVGKHVERLDKKIEHNQQTTNTNIKNLEKQMDGKFATMESNLLKAIQASKEATPSPPGKPGPSGAGLPSFSVADATARYDSRPGVEMAPTPPWVNDVTTPHFNRAPDATKLFFVIFTIGSRWQNPNSAENAGVGCRNRA